VAPEVAGSIPVSHPDVEDKRAGLYFPGSLAYEGVF
jgi:hypothetical protein